MRRRQARRKPTAETAALHIASHARRPAPLEGIPGDAGDACKTREYREARATPVTLVLNVLVKQQRWIPLAAPDGVTKYSKYINNFEILKYRLYRTTEAKAGLS